MSDKSTTEVAKPAEAPKQERPPILLPKRNALGDSPAPAEAIPQPQSGYIAAVPDKALSIDPASIPKEATQEQAARKPYWIGRCVGAPFHSVHVASIAFQTTSFSIVNGAPANQKIGSLIHLTDEEVKKVMEDSMRVAWRKNVVKKKVGREVRSEIIWERIDLRRANEALLPGDKLTAHFIFMVKLEPGQKIPLGVVDDEGNPLPTPKPLIVAA